MKYFLSVLLYLFTVATSFAVSVEKIPILPRQSGVFATRVKVVLNTQSGQSLVIWEKYPGTGLHHSVWGRLLLADGKTTGPTFSLIAGPNVWTPDVIYNPDQNQFLLTYSNDTTGKGRFEIFAVRLTAAGCRAGQPVRVSIAEDKTKDIANRTPRVVYDSATKGYVIVWSRAAFGNATGVQEGVHAAVLNTDLTVRQAPVLVMPLVKNGTTTLGPTITDVALHGPSQKLLIAANTISTQPGFSWQYVVARLDKTLKKPTPAVANLKSGLSSSAAPDASFIQLGGGQMAALLVEGTGVKMRKLNAQSAPMGAGNVILFRSCKDRAIGISHRRLLQFDRTGRSAGS